ncbi:MAG TPA: Rrf2 family transcriptional regulator [Saprospiraceae bacterium]|nr:Rrf2 family transcriptional regulator [Saprospiraceae bacterium]
MFSKSCQYALQAILYIAMYSSDQNLVTLKEISDSQDIPKHFLGKIMQELSKRKFVISITGPNGGFYLSEPPESMYLMSIVEAIDGLGIFDVCGIGFKTCSDASPCPLHKDFKIVKNEIRQLLSQKSVVELCQDVKDGKSIVSFKS